jgi:uncharacterized protein YbjT (DUF2867 family)
MTILVTGGRGAVANAVAHGLVEAGVTVRVAGRSPAEIAAPDGVDVVLADLTRPETLPAALDGVDRVFLYAEPSGIAGFVDAATAAGVKQVVLLSSMAASDPDGGPIAMRHRVVEDALSAAPFAATFVRPGAFATNARQWLRAIRNGEDVRLAIPESTDAPIDERDIADVVVTIFRAGLGGPHDGTAPEITGPESLSRRQMVETLAGALGKEARIVPLDVDAARAEMSSYPAAFVESILRHWVANDGVVTAVTDGVERITGRPARTFADWARRAAARGGA